MYQKKEKQHKMIGMILKHGFKMIIVKILWYMKRKNFNIKNLYQKIFLKNFLIKNKIFILKNFTLHLYRKDT